MNAEQLFTRRRSATVYPASCIVHPASSAVDSQRSNVQTCKRSNASTFNPLHLILEKKKIQITIEEQILTAFRLSPVARLRSVSQLCTVHGQWSIVNLQSSTFNFQPIAFDPPKREFKKQTKSNIYPPLHIRPVLIMPPHIRFLAAKQPYLNRYCTELFPNNSALLSHQDRKASSQPATGDRTPTTSARLPRSPDRGPPPSLVTRLRSPLRTCILYLALFTSLSVISPFSESAVQSPAL
jgi:hypothetical protein